MRKKLNFILASIGIASIGISTGIVFGTQNNLTTSLNIKKEASETESNKGVVPLDYYAQTPLLTQSTGPIISYGNKISAVDWYGAEIWTLDLTSSENEKYLPGGKYLENQLVTWTNRIFVNWAIDLKNNKLWLLSNTFNKTTGGSSGKPIVGVQNLIEVDSLTGKVLSSTPLTSFTPPNDYQLFYQIQVLANGNVQIYSQGNDIWGRNILVDAKTKQQTYTDAKTDAFNNSIREKMKKVLGNYPKGEVRLLYLIPVVTNVNIAVFSDFATTVDNAKNGATSDLFLCLVDDSLKEIKITDQSSPWYDYIHIKNTSTDLNDNKKAHSFNKSFYTTLDGKVYYSAWEKFFIFYPTYKEGYGVGAYQYNLGTNKRVQSYTMDVNENVFIKYWEDTKIYKFTITGNSEKNATISPSTYYDIASSSEPLIKDNADKFVLYNVTGYTGSIMMLSSRILTSGSSFKPTENVEEAKNYGIAASIVPNKNNQEAGDTLGLLNTDKSFLKSSDFKIEQSILDTKIPSEITRSDLTLENGGFFTNNTTKNSDGTLKYPPFKISEINDTNGTFSITVNLDQIPWFTTTLPSNAIPKTIRKEFNTKSKIDSKISWKSQDSLSYDFKNTIPSKLSNEDIMDFDPFQASFNSQTILDSNGKVLYPKKTYTKSSNQDTEGTVVIQVKYEYVPLGITYSSEKDVLSITKTQTYTIFKSTENKEFYFAGATSAASGISSTNIDINTVPQLKALSESSLLPSSFNADNRNSFLQFINTNKSKGYPISRMNFRVEPNDEQGTLKVIATVDPSYDNSNTRFEQVFTGFNKKTNYSFSFNEQKTQIGTSNFSTLLASSVNEGDVVNDLITYTGFNSSDFSISLNPDDETGTLNVTVNLNKSYASTLGNSNGFNNYQASFSFKGFMTVTDYNSQYNITFRDDNDIALLDLKKMTLSSIDDGLKNKNLKVGNQTYTSLNNLIYGLFIKEKGSKIPTNWNGSSSGIETKMSYDNQAGTLNLSIKISKSLLNGYDSDLNYVISYSGFTKGNIVVTDDNLSFVDPKLLLQVVPELEGKTPTEMKEWLDSNSENLRKILFNVTGQYDSLITLNQYTLEIDANDSYNIISITIKFENVSDEQSLKEYSIQYTL